MAALHDQGLTYHGGCSRREIAQAAITGVDGPDYPGTCRDGLPAGKLETAAVVAGTDGGELKAIVGGREAGYSGFNRALNSRRQIGSLIKPAVYLAALSKYQRYNLLSGIDDGTIEIRTQDGQIWIPENFDKTDHGIVPLHTALTNSYNRATVRLGMDIGLHRREHRLYAERAAASD